MYYEEKVINGILHCRTNPTGEFKPKSLESLTIEILRLREKTLSQPDRKEVLLKAAYDLLKECDKGIYVKNALETVVLYDNAECDGACLMEDIAIELGIDEYGE
jgi:hypothetical protein